MKALLDAGVSQADIARTAGVSASLVGQVMRDDRKSRRVLQALVLALGVTKVERLWPDIMMPEAGPLGLLPLAANGNPADSGGAAGSTSERAVPPLATAVTEP